MALTAGPEPRVAVPPAPAVRARRGLLASRRRQVVAGVVIAGAIGFVVWEGLGNATEYFETADQAVAHRATLGTRQFRIEGTVLDDVRRAGSQIQFSIYANGVTVPVVDTDQPSQLFKPGIPVVLEGHWAPTGNVYDSDQIMVKHTASYTAAHPQRLQSQLPSTTVSR